MEDGFDFDAERQVFMRDTSGLPRMFRTFRAILMNHALGLAEAQLVAADPKWQLRWDDPGNPPPVSYNRKRTPVQWRERISLFADSFFTRGADVQRLVALRPREMDDEIRRLFAASGRQQQQRALRENVRGLTRYNLSLPPLTGVPTRPASFTVHCRFCMESLATEYDVFPLKEGDTTFHIVSVTSELDRCFVLAQHERSSENPDLIAKVFCKSCGTHSGAIATFRVAGVRGEYTGFFLKHSKVVFKDIESGMLVSIGFWEERCPDVQYKEGGAVSSVPRKRMRRAAPASSSGGEVGRNCAGAALPDESGDSGESDRRHPAKWEEHLAQSSDSESEEDAQ
eukprot:m51a1_g3455 hypothetical protein (340) ;mRNA; r:687838-689080